MKILLRNISKSYGNTVALADCSVVIEEGSFHAVIGPNGSGKSTLLRIVSLLEAPDGGELVFTQADVSLEKDMELRRNMAVVLPGDSLFTGSVFNNVAYGLRIRKMNSGIISDKVSAVLKLFELSAATNKNVSELSTGQRQRVALARALVLDPLVLFLDEPTVSLDPVSTGLMEEILGEIRKNEDKTVVMITHNMFQARRLADRVSFMYRGRVVESDERSRFFSDPAEELTRRFITGKMVW